MYINNIGYNHTHDADFLIQRPSGSGGYLLLLLKTPAIFTFGREDVITEPDSFILFRLGSPQFYRAYGSSFSNDWFDFAISDDELCFFKNLEIPFDRVVKIGEMDDLSLIVKNMAYENYSSNQYKKDSVELYMKLFFLKLSEKIHGAGKDRSDSYYDKLSIIRSQIYNQPYHDWNVEGLSHQLTMSKSYFQHLYKNTFGVSAVTDIITSRIDHSKYLLSTTDIPIAHVAEMCGYKCQLHFMRQFKARMNMTPTEYRQSVSAKK